MAITASKGWLEPGPADGGAGVPERDPPFIAGEKLRPSRRFVTFAPAWT